MTEIDHEAFREFERAGWQRTVDDYHNFWEELTSQAASPLLDAVEVKPGMRLLDVATGPGYVAAIAASRGAHAVGVDLSESMVFKANDIFPDVEFREGDAENLPFADNSFDAVTINFGMLHFGRPEQALAEAHRVLRSGGKVGFTNWATPEEAKAFSIIFGAIKTHGTLDVPLPQGPPFFRFSDHQESKQVLLETGFVDPIVIQIPQLWRLPSTEALIDAYHKGTARSGSTLDAQSPEALAAIRAAIAEAARVYDKGGYLEIPMPAVLSSAIKP